MSWTASLVIFYTAAATAMLWHHAVDLAHRLIEIADHTTNNTDLPLAGGLAQVGPTAKWALKHSTYQRHT